ncbi:MAG TPA: PIN domain-containing protein [Fimbriimonas sp.]|nr:PIN domain-containing protein [Fimbriimonas sp.]
MTLVDTNVWIRLAQADSPHRSISESALQHLRQVDELCVCAQVIIEFWAVASRPITSNGLGLSIGECDALVQGMLQICRMLHEPTDMSDRWLTFARKYGPVGKPCHDLRLVVLAEAHGVQRILSFNRADFARFGEVQAIDPSQVGAR